MLSDKEERRQLLDAIEGKKFDKVTDLIKNKKVRINRYLRYNDNGWKKTYTPLCVSMSFKCEKITKLLLESGADPNKVVYSENGVKSARITPLYIACKFGDVQLIRQLILAGADVNNGGTMDCLEEEEEGGTMTFQGDGNTCLHWAVMHKSHPVTATLLDCGADPLKYDERCELPIHIACQNYDPVIIEMLVKAGGGVPERDSFGMTPLQDMLLINYGGKKSVSEAQVRLVWLFLASGYDLSADSWFQQIKSAWQWLSSGSKDNQSKVLSKLASMDMLIDSHGTEFVQEFVDHTLKPQPLKYSCRIVIRKSVGTKALQTKIPKLPLPKEIINYLQLNKL